MIIFAHYWGIDEIGVFVIPVLLAWLSLRWADRRARKAAEAKKDTEQDQETADE